MGDSAFRASIDNIGGVIGKILTFTFRREGEITMLGKHGFDRRTLLRGSGLAVGAVGAMLVTPGLASAGHSGRARQVQEPQIYDTGNWGARQPSGPITVLDHRPTYIVVHHTYEPGNTDDFSLERAFQSSRNIQNHHMDTNGWVDSGQQFTISRGGYITEGRHRSLEVVTGGYQHVQGANVGDHNNEVIGIENEGDYRTVDVTPMLWDSLVDLVAFIAAQYEISPDMIRGHRDFNSTECPGDVLYGRIPELKQAVAERLGVSLRAGAANATTQLLRPGDTGAAVVTAQEHLRARGYRVRVNGEFDDATRDAAADFAERNGLGKPTCCASAHADERGYIGRDVWQRLVVR